MKVTDRPDNALLRAIDVVVLCGGLGTRLRPAVADRPKGLAPVAGRPFLDLLVDDLIGQGLTRVIFCVGYLKEQIIERFEGRRDAEYLFAQEDEPLGTGGAVRNALPLVRSDPFIVMNGDSRCAVDLGELYALHVRKSAAASFALTRPDARDDTGSVSMDPDGKITAFAEKSKGQGAERRFVNAGIYVLQRNDVAAATKAPPYSLESDVFPALVKRAACYGLVVEGALVDIGTPDRYQQANAAWNQ